MTVTRTRHSFRRAALLAWVALFAIPIVASDIVTREFRSKTRMPDVEMHFRTVAARDGRVIGGLSMGGYGSLSFVFKYLERFAAAALLSPAMR